MARPRKPIPHGTPNGYSAHRYRNETPCAECSQAWSDYYKEYRNARK